MAPDIWSFVVICLEQRAPDEVGYTLATRQIFPTASAAKTYARTIAPSRTPIVVEGRWHMLRLPSPRPAPDSSPGYTGLSPVESRTGRALEKPR
jgi:hypothetical protein